MFTAPKPYPKEFRDEVVNVARNHEPGQHVKQIAVPVPVPAWTAARCTAASPAPPRLLESAGRSRPIPAARAAPHDRDRRATRAFPCATSNVCCATPARRPPGQLWHQPRCLERHASHQVAGFLTGWASWSREGSSTRLPPPEWSFEW